MKLVFWFVRKATRTINRVYVCIIKFIRQFDVILNLFTFTVSVVPLVLEHIGHVVRMSVSGYRG